MEKFKNYASSPSRSRSPSPANATLLPELSLPVLDPTPAVDISELREKKRLEIQTRFFRENTVETKQNHLSGQVDYHHVDAGKFEEQFYNFENFGYAHDPSDYSGHLVTSTTHRKIDIESNVNGRTSTAKKRQQKLLRK